MHREPDVGFDPHVGFDPESPGSRPGPKAGAKPLRHPGIPSQSVFDKGIYSTLEKVVFLMNDAMTTKKEWEATGRGEKIGKTKQLSTPTLYYF